MSDLYKRLQSITLLAQELHISLADAQRKLDELNNLRKEINEVQREAAIMVDEMLD